MNQNLLKHEKRNKRENSEKNKKHKILRENEKKKERMTIIYIKLLFY
jgi:hypothetical protein